MNKIQAISQRMADLRKEMSEMGQESIFDLFKDFFAKHPEITGIQWSQYTPYFNDGEPCVFSVGSDYSITRNLEGEWSEYGEDGDPEISKLLGEVPDEMMLAIFGDHAEIIMSNTGQFEVSECSHD